MIEKGDPDPALESAARALLEWYSAMGVTAVVSNDATDWLSRGDTPPTHATVAAIAGRASAGPQTFARPQSQQTPRGEPPPAEPVSRIPKEVEIAKRAPIKPSVADNEASDERQLARSASSLTELRTLLERFDGCPLKVTAKNLCFFRGAEKANLMVIGEGPGREEDQTGLPFVGRAGKLLDKMLASIHRSEADTHITNVVYWRPPGNRTPTEAEVHACRPFLERQTELVDPQVIVAVGGAAAKSLLNTQSGIMKLRGRWQTIEIGGKPRLVMATLHPAYLLRTPAAKRMAWKDLLAIEGSLRGDG